MKYYLLAFILFCSVTNSKAQVQTTEDPIDKAYESCKAEHNTPAGMANCAFDAYKHWDSDLNKYYNKVIKLLKKRGDISTFKKSQAAWVTFRDAEFTAYNN